jgi:RecJ-like exonuclease
MKNKILMVGLAVTLLTATACSEKKESVTTQDPSAAVEAVDTTTALSDTTSAAVPNAAVAEGTSITAKGEVTEITPGKDGYMAKIKDSDGKFYTATISIPNMADPKQYRSVKVGDVVKVSGTTFMLGEETGIKVISLQ